MLKPRCYSELYNDLDREVVNVFRVLQNRIKARHLETRLRVTPFSREEFNLSYMPAATDVERARRTIIRSFMGFGSDSISRLKATRAGFNTRNFSLPRCRRASATTPTAQARRPRLIGRTTRTTSPPLSIACRVWPSKTATPSRSFPRLTGRTRCHYVDPPYPMSTRRIGNGSTPEHRYRWEMNDDDHRRLAECLKGLKGMVVISSYPSEFYDELYCGWRKMQWTAGNLCSANTNAQTRTEVAWMNEQAWERTPQRLFDHHELLA